MNNVECFNYDRDELNEKFRDLCQQYYHDASYYGVKTILGEFEVNKGEYLVPMLSKHPNWDPEKLHIVFSQDYERRFDITGIWDFLTWLLNVFNKTVKEKRKTTISGYSYEAYSDLCDQNDKIEEVLKQIGYIKNYCHINDQSKIGAFTFEQLKMICHTLRCERKSIERSYGYVNSFSLSQKKYSAYLNSFYSKEDAVDLCKFYDFIDYFNQDSIYEDNNKVTDEMIEKIIGVDDDAAGIHIKGLYPNIKTGKGTTITKLFRKVCNLYPELWDYSETTINSWYDDHGNYQEREKVITLESKLSELGDRISPLKIKRHTVISVNPLDYLTMSFGNGWASCQTIDKENLRDCHHSYEGQYCSGTLSYMLDKSSLIFYTVSEAYTGNEFETQDKINRCVFNIGPNGNVIIQGRVYPDARDNGDFTLAKQFREVMQKIISDCTEKPNFWTVKKGADACREITNSTGTHYRDYLRECDCNVSYRQNVDDYSTVYIGHYPIDPDTGEEHSNESSLNEYYNESEYVETCPVCGSRFNREFDSYVYCDDNDTYYCCSSCAEDADIHFCENDQTWHEEEYCYQDAWDERWYSGDPEIVTSNYEYYYSEYHARSAGYEYAANVDVWCPVDELHYDNIRDEYFREDDDSICINDELWFEDADSAEEAGYVEINGTWYTQDEANELEPEEGEIEEIDLNEAEENDNENEESEVA